MRKVMIVVAAIILIVTGTAFALKPHTGVTHTSQASVSSFELMSNAKDLPTASKPDAF
jgi:hypothetical protein